MDISENVSAFIAYIEKKEEIENQHQHSNPKMSVFCAVLSKEKECLSEIHMHV